MRIQFLGAAGTVTGSRHLVEAGFPGPVYASPATRELRAVLLMDSAHLQEREARRANRYHTSRHTKALPLHTFADAQRAMTRFRALLPWRELELGPVRVPLTPVGHLLGACAITVTHGPTSLAVSDDLGRRDDLPMPAFAVGRAQALLLLLQRLKASGAIPRHLPIFLDSPMAIEATAVYRKFRGLLRTPPSEIETLCDGVRLVTTPVQSQRLTRLRYPSVIISASGMAIGCRVLHHLKTMVPFAQHHVAFARFQVGGSRGAHLVGGASEVKIHGECFPVRADVSALEGVSGHADADQIIDWLRAMRLAPRETVVVHGEPDAADTLRRRIKDELG